MGKGSLPPSVPAVWIQPFPSFCCTQSWKTAFSWNPGGVSLSWEWNMDVTGAGWEQGGHRHGSPGDILGMLGSECWPPEGHRQIGKIGQWDAGTCLPSWMEQLEPGWKTAVFCLQTSESIRTAEITDFSGLLGKKSRPTPFQKLSEQRGWP